MGTGGGSLKNDKHFSLGQCVLKISTLLILLDENAVYVLTCKGMDTL